jgi:cytochrome P450
MARRLADPYGDAERLRAQYGDVYTVRIPGERAQVMCSDPEGVRYLTTAGYDELERNAAALRFLVGDSALILLQDREHKETRKLLMPPFVGERMRSYGADMAAVADGVFARWRDGERLLLAAEMQEITLHVIMRSVFGITDAQRMARLESLFIGYLNAVMTPWFYGATLVLSGARVRDFLRARGERVRRAKPDTATLSRLPVQSLADTIAAIDAILYDEIARCRQLSPDERAQRSDVLSLMVSAQHEDGTPLSDEQLHDNLILLLIGGHETSATSLCWAVHCALDNPGTWERMRAEVESTFGDGFDPSRIKQLSYLGAVLSESARLYPIATGVPRRLKKPARLGRYDIPAGTMVVPSIYLTQRDPRLWDEPNAFRPQRFLDGKASVYQYFPFGAGVWRCLGAQFSEYEMRVVLARLVAQFDIARAPGPAIKPVQRGFTVAPSEQMPVLVRRSVARARAA